MFETIDITEVESPAIFKKNGARVWPSVSLNLHIAWFKVIYRMQKPEDDSKIENIIFVTRAEQIAEMILIEDCQILKVYLMSPGHINGSDDWKMDKIKEVWIATLKNDLDQRGRIYVLDDGNEYVHSYITMDKSFFTKKELIFGIKNTDEL